MARYGIVVDMRICIACNACTMACKVEHGTQPGVFWCKVLDKEEGSFPAVKRTFVPVLCNHCAEPPCEDACPTGATHINDDGIVLVDYEKCMGCGACIIACPYDARTFVEEERFYFPNTPMPYGVDELRGLKGVVQKCNFCVDRLARGEEPACVEVCPTSCRVFGDLDDPASEISQLMRAEPCVQLLKERNTDPKSYYIR